MRGETCWQLYAHDDDLVAAFQYPIDAVRAAVFLPAGAYWKHRDFPNAKLYILSQNDRLVLNTIRYPYDQLHIWFKDANARLTAEYNRLQIAHEEQLQAEFRRQDTVRQLIGDY